MGRRGKWLLLHDDSWPRLGFAFDLLPDVCGDCFEGLGRYAAGGSGGDRRAGVGGGADIQQQRELRPGTSVPSRAPPAARRHGRKYRSGVRNSGSRRSSCSPPARAPARAPARTSAPRAGRRSARCPAAWRRSPRRSARPAAPWSVGRRRCRAACPPPARPAAPHVTWPIICSSAPITIGPRQIIGVSSSTRKPIDMHLQPPGLDRHHLSASTSGLRKTPSMRGRLGP